MTRASTSLTDFLTRGKSEFRACRPSFLGVLLLGILTLDGLLLGVLFLSVLFLSILFLSNKFLFLNPYSWILVSGVSVLNVQGLSVIFTGSTIRSDKCSSHDIQTLYFPLIITFLVINKI